MKYKRILLIEDDASCQTIMASVIHSVSPGATVDIESSAEGALNALTYQRQTGHAYDLIIADIFLAGKKTGIELWQDWFDQFRDTPLVLTSSIPLLKYFDYIGPNNCAPSYLLKPYELNECRSTLASYLR